MNTFFAEDFVREENQTQLVMRKENVATNRAAVGIRTKSETLRVIVLTTEIKRLRIEDQTRIRQGMTD